MTGAGDEELGLDGDDALAAEYVMGVLPAEDRQAAKLRISRDQEFSRLVGLWEARLAPLDRHYAQAEPPPAVKASIDARLFGPKPETRSLHDWFNSVSAWRTLAAAIAVALIVVVVRPLAPPRDNRGMFVASLSAPTSDARFVVVYNADANEVRLRHVAGVSGPQRDFQLWLIQGQNAPVSLGVIPPGVKSKITMPAALASRLAAGGQLAVSVEPAGGSPTGQPTGPVVATGGIEPV